MNNNTGVDKEVDKEIVEMMDAVFAAHREQLTDNSGQTSRDFMEWDLELWAQLTDLGLARLTGSESIGGSGASWLEAAEFLRAAASNAVLTPFVEHDLLAGWLLETAGLPVDDARRSACILDHEGLAHGVGWAAASERVVVAWQSGDVYQVADVDRVDLRVTPGANICGEPRDTVAADTAELEGAPVSDRVIEQFWLRGSLARAVQVCAALEQTLAIAITHATERVQFGRPLAKFQAVQNLIADIAAEASLCRAATDAALEAAVRTDWSDPNLKFLAAVARSCIGPAATTVVRNAHQVLGAIGTTQEHRLHEFTLPALAWRSEFGSLHHWDQIVTTAAIASGAEGLWPLIVD